MRVTRRDLFVFIGSAYLGNTARRLLSRDRPNMILIDDPVRHGWTTPRTWQTGDLVTAADFNQMIREAIREGMAR